MMAMIVNMIILLNFEHLNANYKFHAQYDVVNILKNGIMQKRIVGEWLRIGLQGEFGLKAY